MPVVSKPNQTALGYLMLNLNLNVHVPSTILTDPTQYTVVSVHGEVVLLILTKSPS